MNIDIPLPVPVSIALIVLGILSILYIFPEIVNIFKIIFKRTELPYAGKPVTKIILITVGTFLIALGFYLLLRDASERSSACIYSKAARSDSAAILWLINEEAAAVLSEDTESIQGIFSGSATIVEYNNTNVFKIWKNPMDRYQELFKSANFSSASNEEIREVYLSEDTAFYTSSSEGTYVMNGQPQQYKNPSDANHWTFKKILGCWKITKFEFNASGVEFP